MSRPTAYRLVKRVMARANIEGPQATGKGCRHGFGVAMVIAANPLPIHILAKAMGHSSTKTTEIYLQVIGQEERGFFWLRGVASIFLSHWPWYNALHSDIFDL